ncbi:MAG: GntR family transcriptional regulator [Planctomycetaceae bacterium]|nr:GntR family transcriptional regulator [Planctomycetaceae bacterium]
MTTAKREELLTVEPLNDRVFTQLKETILRHELKPGTRLVDSQLAERYGISRTPVRDAIRKLAEVGLVTTAQKGYYVYAPNRKDIVEIYELRLVLHQWMARKLVTEVLPANYDLCSHKLDEIETRLRDGIARGPEAFTEYDVEFHDSLMHLANNAHIADIYANNTSQTQFFRYKTSIDSDRIAMVNTMHLDLLQAIKEMDVDKALKVVTDHNPISRKDALAVLSVAEE